MSQENAEIVRRAFTAMNARSVEEVEQFAAPDLERRPLLTAGGDLERPVYRGPAGIVQYWNDIDEFFDGAKVEVEDLDSLGPQHVLFAGRITARGRASGVAIDEHIWAVWELHDRRLLRGTAFRSRIEALAAAGLTE